MDYSPPPNPQALLFMRFSRQEYWSGFPCPFPGDLPHPGIKSVSFGSPALVGGFLTTSATWEACLVTRKSESEVAQSCLTLCDHLDCSLPGSSIHGIFQARVLEWVAISFYNACMHAKSLQSCPTLCDPIDSSLPGSSVPGILQGRTLEWAAISFSNA